MILSEDMNSLTKDWASRRIARTPIVKADIFKKFRTCEVKILLQYKAIIVLMFLLLAQFSFYDFDITEYSTSNHHGANTKIESTAIPNLEHSVNQRQTYYQNNLEIR